MVQLGPLAAVTPPLAIRPELTDDDVAWLNEQMSLTEHPPVTYARRLPPPPRPSPVTTYRA